MSLGESPIPTDSEFLDPALRQQVAQTRRGPRGSNAAVLENPIEPIRASGLNAALVPLNSRRIQTPPATPNPATALRIGAFIFDVDGVLADTAERHTDAWRRLAFEENLDFDERIADGLRGVSRAASLRLLLGERDIPAETFAEFMERKNRYFIASLDSLSPSDVLPGVSRIMTGLSRMGVKIAAASASKNARLVLDRIGLSERFDAIVDGNEVGRPKPEPDLFLRAAARLRLRPESCVVVEDAAAGISAARAAGMRSIGLGDADRLCAATVVLPTFGEIDVDGLLEMLADRGH